MAGVWPDFEVTFESGDGRGRNTDYKFGVEVILARLGQRGGTLTGVWISSKEVLKRAAAGLVDPAFAPTGFELPIALMDADANVLRRKLGHAGALVDSKPGSSGNTTRRMTLAVHLPRPIIAAPAFEAALEEPGAEPALALLTNLVEVDAAMGAWLEVLEAGARAVTKSHRWIATEAIMFRRSASNKRDGVWDVELGVRASGEPWSVQLNAPTAAADANGLTTIARDPAGRLSLIRQGLLRPNPDSDGEIRGDRFRQLSGLTPIKVTGGSTPQPREWYVVARLDLTPEEIGGQTGAFVHACAQARLASLGATPPDAAPPLFAADEKGGVMIKKALEAQPAKEVRRLQGEVWLELKRLLEAAGVRMAKPRHQAGYEVDGIVYAQPRPILLEIKTGVAAADVYEGVGQLMLYGEMLHLVGHRRILLLPAQPQPALVSAVEACGMEVHDYEIVEANGTVAVRFSEGFRKACGEL